MWPILTNQGCQKTEMVMIQASQELNTQAILKKWRRWSEELSRRTQKKDISL